MDKFDINPDKIKDAGEKGGEKLGKATKGLMEFLGDAIGLALIKTDNKDMAYKTITKSRELASKSQKLVSESIKSGSEFVGDKAVNLDLQTVKDKANDLKDKANDLKDKAGELKDKVKNFDFEKTSVTKIKDKVTDMFNKKMAEMEDKANATDPEEWFKQVEKEREMESINKE